MNEPTFQYIRNLNAIRSRLVADTSRPEPSWVRITTITMCSKFLQEIDLKKFRENFAKMGGSITVRRRGSRFRGFEWKMKDTAFYNQVTIGYQDVYSRKSIKLFPNGSIQVAGCSDLFDCRRILKQLAFILKVVLELLVQGDVRPRQVQRSQGEVLPQAGPKTGHCQHLQHGEDYRHGGANAG